MSGLFANFSNNFQGKECGTGIFGGLAPSSLQAGYVSTVLDTSGLIENFSQIIWTKNVERVFFGGLDLPHNKLSTHSLG